MIFENDRLEVRIINTGTDKINRAANGLWQNYPRFEYYPRPKRPRFIRRGQNRIKSGIF